MNDASQKALRRALARPRYEIVPMRGALDEAKKLPAGAVITETCSPTRGLPPTIDLAESVAALDYTAVPHLAARRFRSRSHLEETLARLDNAGIQDVFAVGGDGTAQSGPFPGGADLIAALAEIKPELRSVGIPCYPEGHASISAKLLDEALDAKCFFAGYMVSQICFDAHAIHRWLEHVRGRGVSLPLYIGIPGVIERHKLLAIALRIGLGDSTRFLKKNSGFWSRLAGPSRFTPDTLIGGLTDILGDPQLAIAGLHINTFNQVKATEAWRMDWLNALTDKTEAESEPKRTAQSLSS
jgi:methylenetetrahydrofolate reductase (NADPH)